MGLSFSRLAPSQYEVHDDDETIGVVRRASSTKPGGRWEAVRADGSVLEGEYLTRRLAATALKESSSSD